MHFFLNLFSLGATLQILFVTQGFLSELAGGKPPSASLLSYECLPRQPAYELIVFC